jgi:heme exporter protein B
VAVKLWSIVHKDLVSECRARLAWPAMLLFGVVVALVFSIQMDLLPEQKQRLVGGLLWLAIFFAGMLAVDRSFVSERQDGCWDALLLYPVSGSTVYLAKLLVNVIALAALQCVLIPLFVVLSDVPLLARPWAMILVALLGNVGIASVGTLLSAMTAGLRQGGTMLVLLVLPMAVPVVLAAAEATRLVVEADLGAEWWRWTQFLAVYAVVFTAAGAILFEFVTED